MKIHEINESTTSGSIASVSAPMSTQSRNASIYGGKKGGNLLTGKKTNKKYANSIAESAEDQAFKQGRNHGLKGIDHNDYINKPGKEKQSKAYIAGRKEGMRLRKENKTVNESKMKQIAMDLETMQDGNFKQKYGKTKEKMMTLLGAPRSLSPKHKLEVNESVPLNFGAISLSKEQLSQYSIDMFEAYNVNKHNQNYKSLLIHMNKNSKYLNETANETGIDHFAASIDRLSAKKEIKPGEMFSILSFIINPIHDHVEVLGFTKPKKVKEIVKNRDGSINFVRFTDNDRYPRVPLATVGNHKTQYPAYFNNEQEATNALMMLKLLLPETWEMDTDSVNDSNYRSGLSERIMKINELTEATLEEEDKLVDPKKGHKRKTGLHGKEQEGKLSRFKHPFKSSGDFVSDSRGNSVCECENDDLAKEVAKALNAYVRTDESKHGEKSSDKWVIKYSDLSSGNEPIEKVIHGSIEDAKSYLSRLPGKYTKALRPFDPRKDVSLLRKDNG